MPRCLNCKQKFNPTVFLQKFCEDEDCQFAKHEYQARKLSGSKPKRSKPIKKVSDKRSVENLQYSADRIVFLGKPENKICPITKKPTTEVHHTYSGKDRAKYYLDSTTWLAVSREGHNWIHSHPKEARELGYLK